MVRNGSPVRRRHLQAHQPGTERGPDGRMVDRSVDRLAEKRAEPPDPFALDDMVRLKQLLEAGDRRHMAADDDRRCRGVLPDQTAHLAHLADVDDDARDADHVVLVGREFLDEALACRKIQQGGRRGDVRLDEHDAPRAMMHPEREGPLRSRHLVVIELERIDRAASVCIVLCEGTEHRGEEDSHRASVADWRARASRFPRATQLLQYRHNRGAGNPAASSGANQLPFALCDASRRHVTPRPRYYSETFASSNARRFGNWCEWLRSATS